MKKSYLKIFSTLISLLFIITANASEKKCPDTPIKFATMGWETSEVMTAIQRFGIEKIIGCDTVRIEGSTKPMLEALIAGYIDIIPELWVSTVEELYKDAQARYLIVDAGETFNGSLEGWWIPDYLAEEYPDIKHITDLKKYANLFKYEDEYSDKALIYSCPIGWICENTNKNLLKALNLDNLYTVYSPNVDEILFLQLKENYERKIPFVTYMWSPEAILADINLVRLKMPGYQADYYECFTRDVCEDPKPSGFPTTNIHKVITSAIEKQYPEISVFIRLSFIPNEVMNELLLWLQSDEGDILKVAPYFYKNYPDIWRDWVSKENEIKILKAIYKNE